MVPASTMETYMMSLLGEYCMAIFFLVLEESSPGPACSSCQLEYCVLAPGRASRRACSMRWTSLRGSPEAGMK